MAKDKQEAPKEYMVIEAFSMNDPVGDGIIPYEAGDVWTLPRGWQEDPNVMQMHAGRLAFTHEEKVGDEQVDPMTGRKTFDKRNVTLLIPVEVVTAKVPA